jgi:hypothetical protein
MHTGIRLDRRLVTLTPCFALKAFSSLTGLEPHVGNNILFGLPKLFTNEVTKVAKSFERHKKRTLRLCETIHQHKLTVIPNFSTDGNIRQ